MIRILHNQLLTLAVAAVGFAALAATPANAQVVNYSIQGGPPVAAYAPAPAVTLLTADQLDQLTGPVALYPDPVLAQLLPAATYPNDIAAAAAWLQQNPQPTEDGINAQPWDPSVKAIVHYPPVFQQLAGNMDWTQALGTAFINQPQDVMASIQRLRTDAQAMGNLAPTADQQVVVDSGCIEILPTNPQFCYIPVYDPAIIFFRRGDMRYNRFNNGAWLTFGFDWGHHWISGGYDWAHYRPGHDVPHRTDIAVHPWVHDAHRPAPVMPAKFVHAPDPHDTRSFEQPKIIPGQPFNVNEKRDEIERNDARARDSHVVQPEVHVVVPNNPPHVDVHNTTPVHVDQHVDVHPEVHSEPPHFTPPPTPIPAFHPAPTPADTHQQSERGNQSMHH